MVLDATLLDLMVDTIVWEELLGHFGDGSPRYGSPASLQARVVYQTEMVYDATGQEQISTVTIWVGSAPGVKPGDRITLPDGTQPRILNVHQYPDEDGAHHERIRA
jgi:hypothetical protein